MRNWLNAARSYMRPIEIGESMRAAGIGRVVDSKSKTIAVGDLVSYSIISHSYGSHNSESSDEEREWTGIDDRFTGL